MAEIKLRTKEELLLPDYNYYIFFKIEPNEKDVAKIEKSILMERNKWTQGQPIQRRYKELYSDVENVMIKDVGYDPRTESYSISGARAAELANAKKLKLGEAVRLITSMAGNKGRLYKSELVQIVSSEKIQWFTVADLEESVKDLTKQGIRYIDDTQSVIDFRKYKEVEKYLITVKKETLYDVIEGKPTDSVADLAKCVSTVYANLKNKTTPEGTATDKLLGIAKIIFKTEETKNKYNDYLAIKKDVWDELELRQSHGIKEITLDEFLAYAEKMKAALRMSIDQVELQLAAGLKEFKIIVVGTGDAKDESGETINLEICPYPECGKAYRVFKDRTIKSCPHCGKALEILCWNCGGKMPYTSKNKTCPTCGGTFQSKALFDARLADVEKIVRLPSCSIIDLRSALTNLKNVVPNYQGNTGSFAYKKIDEYEKLITKKIKEEETTGASYKQSVEKIQEQMALKNYQQALNLASNLRRTYTTYNVNNTAGLINDINKVISQAQAQVQQAKAYLAQKNENQVIACVSKALDICADYSEARQLLPPPEAPSNVRLGITGNNAVRIEWVKNGNQNLTTYTVIKKVGSKPTSITDGTVIESNLTINFYEDSNVVSATPYYYAVFADRCEKPSALAVSNGAVQVFLDVQNVRQEVVTDSISVKWDVPHNVKAVEVWKKEGPVAPSGAGDGTRVVTKTLDGFTDSAVSGECSYLILCQYDLSGIKKYSQGIRRVFKKYEQLHGVDKVSILPQPTGEFLIKCTQPQGGKLSIVYSKERLSCRVDTVLQKMDFNKLCKNTLTSNIFYDSEQNMLFNLPQNQIVWAYPMVSNEQLFILSSPVLLNTIQGIRNVSFSEVSGTVRITGTVDAGIKNVIVKVSYSKFPQDIDDEGDKISVPKDRFMADNGAVVKLKADTLSYISVFTEIEQNGKTTYTRAIPISDEPIGTLRKKVVQYAIDYTVSPTKPFPLTIKFSADEEVDIPRLCIMKGYPSPMDKNSGELVDKIESVTLKKGLFSKKYTAKITVTAQPDSMKMKFKVFVDDDSKKHVQLKAVMSI
ncbi:MAG: hypothetical protein J6D21_08890 [Clostridia bacterium]|nr:hypothetical protein [Clostridia bacterium]